MYRELIPALADHYNVVAPDPPGFGFTEASPGTIVADVTPEAQSLPFSTLCHEGLTKIYGRGWMCQTRVVKAVDGVAPANCQATSGIDPAAT
jgi:pimeloyl-ACP methyl ester carboxylesterase